MAKIVWKTTPKAAYEWVEVEGGSTMSGAETKAFLDELVEENGLVPVESTFVGETPHHKFGRYKAGGAMPQALAPQALGAREGDLTKANAEVDRLKAELARANAQLGKQPDKSKADVVDEVEQGIGSAGIGTTEELREVQNTQDGMNLVGGGEEVHEDMSTADRSADNPKVDEKRGPGRPAKAK
ncbi:MAG: hypothetical protein WC889_02825 [Myxococcota bacterium]|jgi:hypothetical protein